MADRITEGLRWMDRTVQTLVGGGVSTTVERTIQQLWLIGPDWRAEWRDIPVVTETVAKCLCGHVFKTDEENCPNCVR